MKIYLRNLPMCFSASASFTVSAILLVGGVVALRKVKEPSQIAFASLPFLFAIQQFFEGFVWLSLINLDYEKHNMFSTFVYVFFAQVVWPFLVPFSIMLLEKNGFRKKLMMVFVIIGGLLTIYLANRLFSTTVYSEAKDYHIMYHFGFPPEKFTYSGIFYFMATVIPALISSSKNLIYFGLAVLASFITSMLFFEVHVISVWCFFAAIISLLIIKIIGDLNKPLKNFKQSETKV